MIKRLLIGLIFLSMVLHSASRLGVLSYLYKQRHDIAFTLGIIEEVPMTMCNSEYDFGAGLQIVADDETDSTLPLAIFNSQEIHLFFIKPEFLINGLRSISTVEKNSIPVNRAFTAPPLSIFHPPC